MSGFREFMPGQVWFYYNTAATKDLERKKELGAVTSRPVVIIQSAFYPEWNDVVTVCPMTSSDRRSGVYIDSTLLKDGSFIEGGTVLPYLLYTVKAKFLYSVMAMNHKRKLLSLSEEDFAEVMKGVSYHLGFSKDPPEYVKNWKHVSDFDREIIMRDVRLAVHVMENITSNGSKTNNPILEQTPPQGDITPLENHVIASLNRHDRVNNVLFAEGSEFHEEPLGVDTQAPKVAHKEVRIEYVATTPQDFITKLYDETERDVFPLHGSDLYAGSEILKGVELKAMDGLLSRAEQLKICALTMKEIMNQTGIASSSTASRLRMQLRDKWSKLDSIKVNEDASVEFPQQEAPEPFIYAAELEPNKARAKRAMRRHKALFSYSKEELIGMLRMDLSEVMGITKLPGSSIKEFKKDICRRFPDDTIDGVLLSHYYEKIDGEVPTGKNADLFKDKFLLVETLSATEMHEVRSCSKRSMAQTAKHYGISKERFRALHDHLISAGITSLPPIDDDTKVDACRGIALGNSADMTPYMLMVFCRCDYTYIAEQYGSFRSANTPSKQEIRKLKATIRKDIVTDFRQRRR